jgi:hypothetical protein
MSRHLYITTGKAKAKQFEHLKPAPFINTQTLSKSSDKAFPLLKMAKARSFGSIHVLAIPFHTCC